MPRLVSPRGGASWFVSFVVVLLLALLLPSTARSQAAPPPLSPAMEPPLTEVVVERVRAFREGHEAEILRELSELLALPNRAGDEVAIRANAEHLVGMLAARGFAARLLESESSPPAVFGELTVPGAEKTLVLYCHYDGQPVDPSRWASPPYQPVLRDGPLAPGATGGEGVAPRDLPWPGTEPPFGGEWRLYARSASDDKGPIVAILAALDALKAAGISPSVNLKVFLEGEEEAGSPHLAAMLSRHRDLLGADAWLFLDGPVHQSRRRQVVFGVRGVMGLELTVYGPLRALHSGHYGNWAPNPAVLLAHLVAELRSPDGAIKIPGFYASVRPLTAADRAALDAIPDPDEDLRRELGLAATEAANARLIERILLPALNVKGLAAGGVGEAAANAIPTEARASLGFRLVPDQTPEEVRRLVENHLRGLGYHLVDREPDLATRRAHPRIVRLAWEGGYKAMRTPLDLPISRAVLRIASEVEGRPALAVPILGGSLPMYLFEDILGVPLLVVPMVNHDNSQHGPNENLRLENLWEGIDLYAALLARLGVIWESMPGPDDGSLPSPRHPRAGARK